MFPHSYAPSSDEGVLASPEAFESWPTGTYIRHAQKIWLKASWNVVPALPDHMLSLAGYVLTSTARSLAPLAPEERLELMRLEWKHLAAAKDRADLVPKEESRPDITAKEDVQTRLFLERMPFAIYLPFIDVDCSDKVKNFDPVESPKRAVSYARTAHEIMKRSLGSLKWKLSNKRGGLHGVPGILPPSLESTDLLLAIDWWVEQECEKAGVPTITTVERELEARENAEILDTTPFNKKARGHGGMYRTPGCVKTDQEGHDKPGSVAQEAVEEHVDELPWLAPLTEEMVGDRYDDFSGMPQILSDFRAHQTEGVEKERKRRNLKPGELPTRTRMARPKVELGGEALSRTVEAIKKHHVLRRLHKMRVALAGYLLFRHGIPVQTATATLIEAFPGGTEDAVRCIEDTIRKIRGGDDRILGRGALIKIIGKENVNEIEEAILTDEQERIESDLVDPLEDDEILEAFAIQEELAAEEIAENDRRRKEAVVAAVIAEAEAAAAQDPKPDDGAPETQDKKREPGYPTLPSLLSYPDKFWDPRLKDVKKGYLENLIAFIEKTKETDHKIQWNKVVWGTASLAVQAGIANGVIYRSFLKAKLDGGDRYWDANKEKIRTDQSGVGGVWTLRRALGEVKFRHFMEALAKDLVELDAPLEVRRRLLKGHSVTEADRHFLEGLLIPTRHQKLGRREPEHALEAILRCESFGANHECSVHGDCFYLAYVCKKDQCRHCRYHREKAKRVLVRMLWPKNERWLISKIPLPDGPAEWSESVEIGDDGLPRTRAKKGEPKRLKGKTKRMKLTSNLLRDRVRQSYYMHRLLSKKTKAQDRWPKKIPHKVVMGFDHALVIAPADHSEDGVPADDQEALIAWMQQWGGEVELIGRDEAIDLIITHQYTIGEAFDDWTLTQGASGDRDDVLSWLAKGTKTVGGNKAGQKALPWPSSKNLQAFLMEQAEKARDGLKVKVGECPVRYKVKNPETGEDETAVCALKCRIDVTKTLTGQILKTNGGGYVPSAREVWKCADQKNILPVESKDRQMSVLAERGEWAQKAQKGLINKRPKLVVTVGPPG